MNDNKAQKMNKNDTHQRFSQENKNKSQNWDHHKKKIIIHVSKLNDNQWRVVDKKNKHAPRGRQNWDHPTKEDIRDHHNNKKKHQTPCGPHNLKKKSHWKTLYGPHQQTYPTKVNNPSL